MYDVLIKNGTVVDGSGAEAYKADVGILGRRIDEIGPNLDESHATRVIDAAGCLVTPGFIDVHCHPDLTFFGDPYAVNELQQGVTTQVGGNCGQTIAPGTALSKMDLAYHSALSPKQMDELLGAINSYEGWAKLVRTRPMGTNIGTYVGHGAIRNFVMGPGDGAPTEEQLAQMVALTRDAMEAGALGLSSGLIYPPGSYATHRELVEMCKVVAEYGGVYGTHMRNEGDGVIESVIETIAVAEEAKVNLRISHHKVTGKKNWGNSVKTLQLIDEAIARGVVIHMDQYPYRAGGTRLMVTMPQEFMVEGEAKMLERLADPAYRKQVKEKILSGHGIAENFVISCGGLQNIMLADAAGCPGVGGKYITEVAAEQGIEDPFDVLFDVLVNSKGGIMAMFFFLDEADIERIMQHPHTAVCSDGMHASIQDYMHHPRLFASFPRVLSHYARDTGLLSLEQAVYKMTGLPASAMGFAKKGLLKAGYDADVVVVDYDHLQVHADYANPTAPNEGFRYVFVNGQLAVESDKFTGFLAGELLHFKDQRDG